MLLLGGDVESPRHDDTRDPKLPQTTSDIQETTVAEDHPPSYTAAPAPETNSHAQTMTVNPVGVKPTNLISIVRRNLAITGRFAIDPTIAIPSTFLSPLPKGETVRKNLHMEAQGSYVDVDLWLISPVIVLAESPPVERATLSLSAKRSVTVSVHSSSSTGPSGPFILSATSSRHHSVTVCVPRNFRGPVTLTSKRHELVTTPAFSAQFAVYSEDKGTLRGFIGELDGAEGSTKAQSGPCELVLKTKGTVRLAFADEMQEAREKWGRKATKRLFSGKTPKARK